MKIGKRARNVAIGSVAITMMGIGSYATVPVYLVPISQMLKVSIGQVALLFTFSSIASLSISFLLGTLLKKVKVRVLVPIAGLALALFFCSIYLANSITTIYIGSVVFGLSTVIAGYGIAQTEITWWFAKGRASIMSFLNIGVGVFGLILAPVVANAIGSFGVRNVALVQGISTGIGIILIGLFLLSEHPATYGMQPEGYEAPAASAQGVPAAEVKSLTVKQMTSTSSFWFIIVAVIFCGLALTGFTNNASAFYQSIGLDAVRAALCISIYNAVKLGWAPLYGVLVDKRGPGFATILCGTIGAVTFVAGTFLTGFVGAVIIAAFIGAISFSSMLGAISFPRVFGTKEAGTLVGFSNAASSIGAMLGAPIAGFIYDATGSYRQYLLIAAALIVFCAVFTAAGTSKKAVENINNKAKLKVSNV